MSLPVDSSLNAGAQEALVAAQLGDLKKKSKC